MFLPRTKLAVTVEEIVEVGRDGEPDGVGHEPVVGIGDGYGPEQGLTRPWEEEEQRVVKRALGPPVIAIRADSKPPFCDICRCVRKVRVNLRLDGRGNDQSNAKLFQSISMRAHFDKEGLGNLKTLF